ncbi:hypothetical protein [Hyalangium sp.]|uniref:hypothetical protein n=1 Tax=Hyalangium sp. TaxID=2028555 RepID=UPI002D49F140|nr:hypothetical protein [Hyalangium sp.]HYH97337.1 hypothetical protein [Hyalangium sp.]
MDATAKRWLLEQVKRPAIRLLHRTRAGEAVLVRVYLEAEEHAEHAVWLEALVTTAPPWLQRWLSVHRAEEARHAEMFRAHLHALTGEEVQASGAMDPVSQWKLRRLVGLVQRSGSQFEKGTLVPALAVAGLMEEMGVRVFERHVEVLRESLPEAPLLPLLERALADERRHAAACRRSVERLTTPAEHRALALLLARAGRIERQLGVAGAVVLWGIGFFCALRTWLLLPSAMETAR